MLLAETVFEMQMMMNVDFHRQCMPLSVFARPTIFRICGLDDFDALAILFAGIFSPSGTWSARCNAPGCLIAPEIQCPALPPEARPIGEPS